MIQAEAVERILTSHQVSVFSKERGSLAGPPDPLKQNGPFPCGTV